jgi:hypothetical protein
MSVRLIVAFIRLCFIKAPIQFLVLFSIVFILSCTKNKNRSLSKYMKYAVNVDTGSVFVYRDSISGIMDTFKVTSNSGLMYYWKNQNSNEVDAYSVEYMNYEMSSTKWHPDTTKWVITFNAGSYGFASIYIRLFEEFPLYTYTDYNARFYSEPFITDTNTINTLTDRKVELQLSEAQYPVYTMHGKEYLTVFDNIHSYTHIVKSPNNTFDTTLTYQTRTLFSLDSGLVKFTIRQGIEYRVKELIYSSIKRKYLE